MSEARVNNLSNESNTGGPTISGITTFSSPYFFVPPVGNTAERPENPEKGSIRFNTDTAHLEYYRGDTIGWTEIEASHGELNGGTRGVKGGGANPGTNVIEFLTISTLGNSQDFGDLTVSAKAQSGAASRTRGLFAAGDSPNTNRIDFITIASTGNAQDFGDIASGDQRHANGMADQTRALFAGGYGGDNDAIDMVTIATEGNTTDFGDLTESKTNGGSCASSTRGIFAAGQNPGYINTIEHITISTTGSAVDSGGDLTVARRSLGGASNSTRGIFFGGQNTNPNSDNSLTNVIDFITIASTGDATDFGDLAFSTNNGKLNAMSGLPSATRVVMPGGDTFSSGYVNTIEYVEISTTGNSTDFGTLATRGTSGVSGFSNGHGGL